ncbi:MAG: hypothetical protein V3W14_05315 [Candidatus Neomarinimicrobiota bacterium]
MSAPTSSATVPVINPGSVILTGGMARSEKLCADIKTTVAFLGPIVVISGSLEMETLAQGVWRVLDGEETARKYV